MNEAQQTARQAAHHPAFERAARAGLGAKGLLFIIIGILALQVALSGGGEQADTQGAFKTLAEQPFGRVLVAVGAAGLACYGVWRLVQAFLPNDTDGALGWLERASYLFRAAVYGFLAASAVPIVLGGAGSSKREESWTAALLQLPFGVVLVTAVGLGVIAVGLYNGYKVATGAWRDGLEQHKLDAQEHAVVRALAVGGLTGRLLVFALAGGFLVFAAVTFDPDNGVGLDGTLQELSGHPVGTVLIALVAVGLATYGLYCLALARYIDPSST